MVFLSPIKVTTDLLALLCLISVICHLSMMSFLIKPKLQRFFQFLKAMTLLCSQTIGQNLFSPVFLEIFEKLFFTSGYLDFSQSLISLIIIIMALDHVTLLLWLS